MWLVLAAFTAVHLLLVNVASGAPIVAMWLEWKAYRGDEAAEAARRLLARSGLYALLAGGLIGGVAFVLIWDDRTISAMDSLASKIKYGVVEYLFSLVLMALYMLWKTPAKSAAAAIGRAFVLLLAGSNLLYHFPFLFLILTNLASGMLPPDDTVTAADFRGLMVSGDVLPRAIHFIVACFAVTGVWLFCAADQMADEKHRESWIRWGGKLALGPTMLQILVGFWIIVRLPRFGIQALMGRDVIATVCLVISVLLAFWLMHLFSKVALGKSDRKGRVKSAIVLGVVVLLMSGVVQRIQTVSKAIKASDASAESPAAQDDNETNDD